MIKIVAVLLCAVALPASAQAPAEQDVREAVLVFHDGRRLTQQESCVILADFSRICRAELIQASVDIMREDALAQGGDSYAMELMKLVTGRCVTIKLAGIGLRTEPMTR